jgi:hypothetical protein
MQYFNCLQVVGVQKADRISIVYWFVFDSTECGNEIYSLDLIIVCAGWLIRFTALKNLKFILPDSCYIHMKDSELYSCKENIVDEISCVSL